MPRKTLTEMTETLTDDTMNTTTPLETLMDVYEEDLMTDPTPLEQDDTLPDHAAPPLDAVAATPMELRDDPVLLALPVEEPFGFADDGWLINEIVVTGVIAPQRTDRKTKKQWTAPTRRTGDGGAYKVFTVRINETLDDADQIGDDLLMTQLEVLIPLAHPLIPHLETTGGTVSLRGRLEQAVYRNMAQERRMQHVENGVYLQRQESVIVRALRLVDDAQPHYAVGHLTGTIDRVLQFNQPLRPGEHQRYHTIRLDVRETRARRAPSRGVEHLTTTLTLLVPATFPDALLLVNPGNPVSVEYGVKRLVRWLSDRQLELVKDEAREKARMRVRDEWMVTVIAPQEGASEPDADRLAAIRQGTAERNRTRRHNARVIRERRMDAAAAAVAAEEDHDTPLAPVKRRRVQPNGATGASGIPTMTSLDVVG